MSVLSTAPCRRTPRTSAGTSAWLRQVRCLALLVLLLAGSVSSCGEGSRACRGEYTARGDKEAVRELVAEFRQTIRVVKEHDNVVLLSEASRIAKDRDFRAMEDWVCRAQKMYGKPD